MTSGPLGKSIVVEGRLGKLSIQPVVEPDSLLSGMLQYPSAARNSAPDGHVR